MFGEVKGLPAIPIAPCYARVRRVFLAVHARVLRRVPGLAHGRPSTTKPKMLALSTNTTEAEDDATIEFMTFDTPIAGTFTINNSTVQEATLDTTS